MVVSIFSRGALARVAWVTDDTVGFLRRSTPQFITRDSWPPNNPDLNPADHKIWGVMQERVYKTAIKVLDDLKRRLIVEWSGLQQSIIDDAVEQSISGANVCIAA